MSKNPLCKKTSSNFYILRKLITENGGSSPDTYRIKTKKPFNYTKCKAIILFYLSHYALRGYKRKLKEFSLQRTTLKAFWQLWSYDTCKQLLMFVSWDDTNYISIIFTVKAFFAHYPIFTLLRRYKDKHLILRMQMNLITLSSFYFCLLIILEVCLQHNSS